MLHTLIVSASFISHPQLNLEANRIGSEGAKSLADALKVNASLTSLVIHSNKLGDEGIDAMATALKESSTSKLASLGVRFNGIGSKGAESLAAYLAVSASMTKMR